jgi:hypothetical protein
MLNFPIPFAPPLPGEGQAVRANPIMTIMGIILFIADTPLFGLFEKYKLSEG